MTPVIFGNSSDVLEICERFNKRTIETFTEYEGKRVKVTTYWDETIPNDLNDAPGALVTKIEPANSVST